MSSDGHTSTSPAGEQGATSSEEEVGSSTASTPCHCANRWLVQIQANRITALEQLCDELVRDKVKIHRRKEDYKHRYHYLEDEIGRFVEERMAYQQRFDGHIGFLSGQFQKMAVVLTPATTEDTEQPRCCDVHATPLADYLQRAEARFAKWIADEELARDAWSEMGGAHPQGPSQATPATPGELSVDGA